MTKLVTGDINIFGNMGQHGQRLDLILDLIVFECSQFRKGISIGISYF